MNNLQPCRPYRDTLPAVCEEAAVGVAGAVAAGRGAGGAFGLEGLPGEGRAIQRALLLPAGCKRAAVRTAVSSVLSTDVALAVTPRHWASGGRRGEWVEGKGL